MSARSRTRSTTLAVLAAGAVTMAACGTDAAAGPGQAVQERLDRGVSVEVTLEADPSAIDDPEVAAEVQDLLDRQAEAPLLVASRSGDGVATALVLHDGAIEVRKVGDTAYLRLDQQALAAATDDDATGPLAELDDLLSDPDAAGGDEAPGIGSLLAAIGEDGWVGVSGLTEERLAELAGMGDDAPDDGEAIADLLAERGLDDLAGLTEGYATVTGEGPWQVEVHARDLATALQEVASEADISRGSDDEESDGPDEDHDLADLPERVGGATVSATDGVATRVVVDLATAVADLDDDTGATERDDDHDAMLAELAASDARLVLDMVDVGDRVDAPTDAAVVDVALLDALLAADGGGLQLPQPQD